MTTITETKFSDIYILAESKKAYIPDRRTLNALMEFQADDFDVFFNTVAQAFDGQNSSYSITYEGILYRIERSEGT